MQINGKNEKLGMRMKNGKGEREDGEAKPARSPKRV